MFKKNNSLISLKLFVFKTGQTCYKTDIYGLSVWPLVYPRATFPSHTEWGNMINLFSKNNFLKAVNYESSKTKTKNPRNLYWMHSAKKRWQIPWDERWCRLPTPSCLLAASQMQLLLDTQWHLHMWGPWQLCCKAASIWREHLFEFCCNMFIYHLFVKCLQAVLNGSVLLSRRKVVEMGYVIRLANIMDDDSA